MRPLAVPVDCAVPAHGVEDVDLLRLDGNRPLPAHSLLRLRGAALELPVRAAGANGAAVGRGLPANAHLLRRQVGAPA